jgi:hypothetical protein
MFPYCLWNMGNGRAAAACRMLVKISEVAVGCDKNPVVTAAAWFDAVPDICLLT